MDAERHISSGFSPVTPKDHAGKLWIVIILSLIYTLHVALVRVYIKYGMFGFDDILFFLATLSQLAESIAVFVGLKNGLAKSYSITTPEQWTISSRSTVAATIFFILSLTFAKCSVLALIRRILGSKPGKSEPFCIALMVFTATWGVGASVSFLINCNISTLLTVDNLEACPHQKVRWILIAALDMATEILTWALIIQLVESINMDCNRRIQVVAAFAFRLPLIAISAVHVKYSNSFPLADDPQLAVTDALLCQQAMAAWSILSATMPSLKNFMKSFRFNIGMNFPSIVDITNPSTPNTIILQTFEAVPNSLTGTVSSSGRPHRWRPDIISYLTTVTRGSNRSSLDDIAEGEELSRVGSQEMIINKEVTWEVTYEDNHHGTSAPSTELRGRVS